MSQNNLRPGPSSSDIHIRISIGVIKNRFDAAAEPYLMLCSIPEALAQTCWMQKEKNGKLHVDEDV